MSNSTAMPATAERSMRPCRYPGCRDTDRNPRLTHEGMCRPCQTQYARLLGWLTEDWITLHTWLPTPTTPAGTIRVKTTRTYGHPAQWASDTAAQIAATLNDLHGAIAEQLHSPPPPAPAQSERYRVTTAYRYLRERIPTIATYDQTGDITTELKDLHQQVRTGLGWTKHKEVLPIPCPTCELKTVTRTADPYDDRITCGNCQFVITEDRYPFFVRMVLDQLLDDTTDTPTPTLAPLPA